MIAASVWIRSSSTVPSGALIDRPVCETIPVVTLGSAPRLSALPIATTSSPTRRSLEEPSSAGTASPSRPSAFTRATSDSGAAPINRASTVWPSAKSTSMSVAPSTTWALVRTRPSALRTTPEPAASPSRVPVWMDTTDGWTFSSSARMSSASPETLLELREGVDAGSAVTAAGESSRTVMAAAVTPPATMAPTRPPISAARTAPPPWRPDGSRDPRPLPSPGAGGPGGSVPEPDPPGPG